MTFVTFFTSNIHGSGNRRQAVFPANQYIVFRLTGQQPNRRERLCAGSLSCNILATISHDLFGNKSKCNPNQNRYDYEVIELADKWNEVGNDVNWAKQIEKCDPQEPLCELWSAGISEGTLIDTDFNSETIDQATGARFHYATTAFGTRVGSRLRTRFRRRAFSQLLSGSDNRIQIRRHARAKPPLPRLNFPEAT